MFTSELTVGEFLLVRNSGYTPVGLVMGGACLRTWAAFDIRDWQGPFEWQQATALLWQARTEAVSTMLRKAVALGASGVIGVQLTVQPLPNGLFDILAVGTAVRSDSDGPSPQPFATGLGGKGLWTLLAAGYAPLGFVLGVVVVNDLADLRRDRFDADGVATARMTEQAARYQADGVVHAHLNHHQHGWAECTEHVVTGTAVRRVAPASPADLAVMSLDLS